MIFLFTDSHVYWRRFTQADVQDHATGILVALFNKIEESGAVAEKVAENDHLMKCL
jgi:hypothetical protein